MQRFGPRRYFGTAMLPLRTPPRNLCIVRLSALGDVTHAVPVLRAIQTAWPDTRITWVCATVEHSLLSVLHGVRFAVIDKNKGWRGYRDLRRQLRGEHFDVMIQMQVSARANLAGACVSADIKLGFDKARSRDFHRLFMTDSIPEVRQQHQVQAHLEFARTLGIAVDEPTWDFPISNEAAAFAKQTLPGEQPTLLVSPSSSHRFRNWRNDRYAAVADFAAERHGMRVLLTGGPGEFEREVCRAIESEMRFGVVRTIISICVWTSFRKRRRNFAVSDRRRFAGARRSSRSASWISSRSMKSKSVSRQHWPGSEPFAVRPLSYSASIQSCSVSLFATTREFKGDGEMKRLMLTALLRVFGLSLLISVMVAGQASASNAPTIRLFPTTVVEDLRQTSSVAKEMETGLQEVIGRLDQQQQLYQVSKCDGAENDSGCQALSKQLGATYLEMLGIMEERLPDMEHTVNNTRLSLEKRLRSELGNKMTSWTLQETLLGGNPADSAASPGPIMRGKSGMRLSERFRQYYQLVASSSSQTDQSLAVLASDIYLDMDETSELIARTREEIARATLIEQLNQSFGTITPEMMEVVGGVKSILFGDEGSQMQIAGPPPASIEKAYRSPLEN
jgi:ADP-heptose:LPS heptosyltransferase